MTMDIILHGGYVVTMEGPGTGVINNGAVAIKGNKIISVDTSDVILKQHTAHRMIDCTGKVIMPGFVDVHMHTSNAIVRGCSQDLKGSEWMFRGILPVLSLTNTQDLVKGSMLNIIEALKAGTTTFGDFDIPMLELIKNHIRVGTRCVVSDMVNELPKDVMVIEHGTVYPLDSAVGNRKLDANTKLIEQYHMANNGRIVCRYGPQAADMCSVELLKEIKSLADHYDVDINMHVAQSNEEICQCVLRTGKRPVDLIEDLGYLNKRLLAAHLTNAEPWEVQKVAVSGAGMCLCTNSISIISGELPPAEEFFAHSDRVGLGTDQAPGNNCNMMWNEMKYCALIHKYKNTDATVFPAWKVLRMATIDAAKTLGMEDQIGSLHAGKLADVIVVDLSPAHMNPVLEYPVRNIIPNLVYSARGNEVETVIIDGQVVMDERKLMTVNEQEAVTEANTAVKRFEKELAKQAWSKDLPLAKLTSEGYY